MEIRTVGVVGAGVMGAGVAQNLAETGHDVVLIDSAPLLAVADTVPLLRYSDAIVLVSRLGVSTRDIAKRLRAFLDRVPDVNVLGVVANDLTRQEASGYGYGYGYETVGDDARDRGRGKTSRARTKQPV